MNCNDKFSLFFFQSGKLVTKMFQEIITLVEDPKVLVIVLLDEVSLSFISCFFFFTFPPIQKESFFVFTPITFLSPPVFDDKSLGFVFPKCEFSSVHYVPNVNIFTDMHSVVGGEPRSI